MLRAIMAGLVCLILGLQAALRLGRRAQALRTWHHVLESISAHCAGLSLPPGEILRLSAENMPGIDALCEHPAGVEEYLQGFALTREERTLIEESLHALFDGTHQQQERQIQYACKRLEQRLLQAEEKQRQDAKLYGMLGVFGGLSVFLVCL